MHRSGSRNRKRRKANRQMAFSAMKKANQSIAHNATQRRIAFYGQEEGSKVHEAGSMELRGRVGAAVILKWKLNKHKLNVRADLWRYKMSFESKCGFQTAHEQVEVSLLGSEITTDSCWLQRYQRGICLFKEEFSARRKTRVQRPEECDPRENENGLKKWCMWPELRIRKSISMPREKPRRWTFEEIMWPINRYENINPHTADVWIFQGKKNVFWPLPEETEDENK